MRNRPSVLFTLFALPLTAATLPAIADTPTGVVSQPYHWRNVDIGGGGGFITGIIFSPTQPDVAYVRTDIGGAYRWNARDKRWVAMTDWVSQADGNLRGTESIAIDPTDPRRVYMAAGTYSRPNNGPAAICRSTDQGRTWKVTVVPLTMGANENGRNIGERLAVDPNDPSVLYFGSRHDGLWRSADYAATWSKVANFPDVPDAAPPAFRPGGGFGGFRNFVGSAGIGIVVFDPRSKAAGKPTQTVYVFADSPKAAAAIYRTTDGGATWNAVDGQPAGLLPEHAALTADGTLYVTYGNNVGPNGITGGAVWKLDTASGAWTDITPAKPDTDHPGGYSGVALDPMHPGTVMVSTLDYWNPHDELFRSRDSGAHWTAVSPTSERTAPTAPWLDLLQLSAFDPATRPRPHFGWWTSALAIDPFHPSRVYYGTGATIWGTTDIDNVDTGKTTHWVSAADGIEETAVIALISPTAGAHLLSGTGDIGGFRHASLDSPPAEGLFNNPIFGNTTGLDFAQNVPMNVVRSGTGSHGSTQYAAYSTDNGLTWKPFAAQPAGTRGAGTIAISPDAKALVWASNAAPVSYSADNGATWTASTGLPAASGRSYFGGTRMVVVGDRVNSKKFYVFDTQTSAVYRSVDGGASFEKVVNNLTASAGSLFAAPTADGDLWVTQGDHGLYHSTDSGNTFALQIGLPQVDTLGFGKAAPGESYPALYAVGTVGKVHGVYRSDDKAATWVRINDDQHQYGWIGQHPITGDPRVYGRVYLATDGRGIQYGDIAN